MRESQVYRGKGEKMTTIKLTKDMEHMIEKIIENLSKEEEFQKEPLYTEEVVFWSLYLMLDLIMEGKDVKSN